MCLKILFKMCMGSLLSNVHSSRCLYQRGHYTKNGNSQNFNFADRKSEESRYTLNSLSALFLFQEAAFPLKISVVQFLVAFHSFTIQLLEHLFKIMSQLQIFAIPSLSNQVLMILKEAVTFNNLQILQIQRILIKTKQI